MHRPVRRIVGAFYGKASRSGETVLLRVLAVVTGCLASKHIVAG